MVLFPAMVGFGDVPQQTPRADIVPMPIEVTTPPVVAVLFPGKVKVETKFVVTVGSCSVVNDCWFP